MTLTVISSYDTLFSGEADSVTLPGVKGSFTVLKNHAPLISVLVPGKVVYKVENGEAKELEIKGGLADIANNKISVCVY